MLNFTVKTAKRKLFGGFCFLIGKILVSLENIQIDVQDLSRGLENAKKELVIRQTMKVMRKGIVELKNVRFAF